MGSFDGSLDSILAAVDAVLDENPRTSGKQLREVLSGLDVDIPTVNAVATDEVLTVNDDGSLDYDGTHYIDAASVPKPTKAKYGDGDLPHGLTLDGDVLNWKGTNYVPQSSVPAPEPVVPGSQALQEAADLLDAKPNVTTTQGKVARWLRTL